MFKPRRWRIRDHSWILWFVFIVGTLAWVKYWGDQDRADNAQNVTAAWSSWVEFRDKQCQPYEKAYDVETRSGKQTLTQNIITYKCSDGILYSVPLDMQQRAEECSSNNGCTVSPYVIPKRPD